MVLERDPADHWNAGRLLAPWRAGTVAAFERTYADSYDLHDKKGALVDIGRELGMFINRTEQGRPGEFDGLNREEMEQHLVDELVAGGIPEKTARAFIRARSPQ